MKNIDVREIRMGKWHIPKSEDIFNKGNSDAAFLAMGYFDMLEVKGTEQCGENLQSPLGYYHVLPVKGTEQCDENPLMQAYNNDYRILLRGDSRYSVQEIKAFTNIISEEDSSMEDSANIRNGFTRQQIDKFWNCESLALYISMVHLETGRPLKDVVHRIREIFGGIDFLYYITFDYSGIVILAKGCDVKEYAGCLLKLNYPGAGNPLIQDTFSVFSLNKTKLQILFKEYSEGKIPDDIIKDTNNYLISINISVKDYSQYIRFKEELEEFERLHKYSSKKVWMLGRHDVSIVNNEQNCDILWLTYVQYLMNKYSSKDLKAFWAFESFVKIASDDIADNVPAMYGHSGDDRKDSWKAANGRLSKAYNEFCNTIEGRYNGYLIPVREVKESVLAILKNGFAEDFIICMYQSFIDFLQYLTGKVEGENAQQDGNVRYSDEFDRCFSEYFSCLNALVNSAMHSDRQFIQATAFNAIIYDVPPKIMAFYVAMVDRIQKIMRTKNDRKYTFFLAPSFNDEISVKIISYEEKKMPVDRILKVSINERSLYNPETVIRRMAHEIAHYVGDDSRKREERKSYIFNTLIYIFLIQILDKAFEININFLQLVDDISGIAAEYNILNKESYCYSADLERFHANVLDFLVDNAEVADCMACYVRNEIGTLAETDYIQGLLKKEEEKGGFYVSLNFKNLSDIDREYLIGIIFNDIQDRLETVRRIMVLNSNSDADGKQVLKGINMHDYMRVLISLYSETYADLQMILLLNISYEEYLMEAIQDEKLDIDTIERRNEDFDRIVVISKLMQDVGIWSGLDCTNENEKVRQLDDKIRKKQGSMQGWYIDGYKEKLDAMKEVLYQGDSQLWEEKKDYEVSVLKPTELIYPNIQLYLYLCECLVVSAEHLKRTEYHDCIMNLRKNIKTMHDFVDIHEVYETISCVIAEYKDELNK